MKTKGAQHLMTLAWNSVHCICFGNKFCPNSLEKKYNVLTIIQE